MAYRLTLELVGRSAALLRAAGLLRRDPRLQLTTRRLHSPESAPTGRVLRLESGSCMRPLLTVLWGEDSLALTAGEREQAALGASAASWHRPDATERWHRLSRPLPDWARLGNPAPDRPWVLVAPQLRVDRELLESTTSLRNAQPHFLRPARQSKALGGVVWLPTSRVLESLLGHVDAVLAPNESLAWDAKRAGTPVFETGGGAPLDLGLRRLARIVPQELVGDASFWHGLVSNLLDGSCAAHWGTLPWLRLARARSLERELAPSGGALLARKLQKLRRDPAGFWADSKLRKMAGFSER